MSEAKVIRMEHRGPAGIGLEDMELNPADFQSEMPCQQVHLYFEDEALGLSVGVWTTTTMQEAFGPYPGDEFMWVLEGEVCMIDGDNQVTRIREGQSFCLRNGIPVSWKQNGFLRKYYMRYDNPALPRPQIDSAVGGVVVLGDGQYHDRLAPMDNSDPFVIAGEAPQQRNYTVFTNDSENLFVGIWDTTAFDSEMRPFPCHEMAQVLEGAISIEEAQGPVHRFVAGDAFFVPMGTECRWYCDGYVKKYYSILDPG